MARTVTRKVRTGQGYVADPGGGPDQWQVTYEDTEFTGEYVADPGGGPDQWGYVQASAFTYYVSYSQGSGSGDGSINDPFQTPAELPPLNPGESVGFLRGDTWPDFGWEITDSGTSEAWITIGAYGDESDPRPIFDNDDAVSAPEQQTFRCFANYIRFQDLDATGANFVGAGKGFFVESNTDTRFYVEFYRCHAYNNILNFSFDYNVSAYMEDCSGHDSTTVAGKGISFHRSATRYPILHAVRCDFYNNIYGYAVVDTVADSKMQLLFEDCAFYANSLASNDTSVPTTPADTWTKFHRCFFRASTTGSLGLIRAQNPTFEYCIVDNTLATGNSMLMECVENGQVTLINCTVVGPSATSRGRLEQDTTAGVSRVGTWTISNCALVNISRVNGAASASAAWSTETHCWRESLATTNFSTIVTPITAIGGAVASFVDRTAWATLGVAAFAPQSTSVLLAANRNETTSVVAESTTDILGNAIPASNPTVGAIQVAS